ncbi:alkylhydroperoxidase [Desulfocarbo indianensis]|nr:alkylhydroperoxidase [Desulfocarbo indianensis]
MSHKEIPSHYKKLMQDYPEYMQAVNQVGELAAKQGPLQGKTVNLIQLAAAAAYGSQGAVHSHTRRAQEAGATPEEIRHAVILLTSTLGFPQVSAALSWIEEVLG